MSKRKKHKNYALRSKVYSALGNVSVFGSTIGGFIVYESIIDWQNFKSELENFVVIQENSLKLNFAIALPLAIGMLVYLIIFLKRNRDFFQGRLSFKILIAIMFCYIIYSIIEVTMSFLVGAFVGTLSDDLIFLNLSKRAKKKAEYAKELDFETEREMRRILARRTAKEELDGSV